MQNKLLTGSLQQQQKSLLLFQKSLLICDHMNRLMMEAEASRFYWQV